jgi:hypothetical protein
MSLSWRTAAVLVLSGIAGQAQATLVTGVPANSENGCWHFIESEALAPIPGAYSGFAGVVANAASTGFFE